MWWEECKYHDSQVAVVCYEVSSKATRMYLCNITLGLQQNINRQKGIRYRSHRAQEQGKSIVDPLPSPDASIQSTVLQLFCLMKCLIALTTT